MLADSRYRDPRRAGQPSYAFSRLDLQMTECPLVAGELIEQVKQVVTLTSSCESSSSAGGSWPRRMSRLRFLITFSSAVAMCAGTARPSLVFFSVRRTRYSRTSRSSGGVQCAANHIQSVVSNRVFAH